MSTFCTFTNNLGFFKYLKIKVNYTFIPSASLSASGGSKECLPGLHGLWPKNSKSLQPSNKPNFAFETS